MYKFRAWDKKEKKFHYFEGIFNQRPYTEKSTFLQYDSSPEYHELILEQFTGLHDRNGNWYGGDLFKDYAGNIYVIEWSEDYAGWWANCYANGRLVIAIAAYSFLHNNKPVKIGNIHESEASNALYWVLGEEAGDE